MARIPAMIPFLLPKDKAETQEYRSERIPGKWSREWSLKFALLLHF
jgi:hypothetical protein